MISNSPQKKIALAIGEKSLLSPPKIRDSLDQLYSIMQSQEVSLPQSICSQHDRSMKCYELYSIVFSAQ